MTERDDDIIEFDFFDEPETEQATQRRPAIRPRQSGKPGGGPPRRPTFRTPQGVTPLLRLILLIALAIFVVIVLVFWVQSCRSESKTNAYRDYMADMKTVGDASAAIGRDLNEQLLTPGVDQQDLIKAIEGLAQPLALYAEIALDTLRPMLFNPTLRPDGGPQLPLLAQSDDDDGLGARHEGAALEIRAGVDEDLMRAH